MKDEQTGEQPATQGDGVNLGIDTGNLNMPKPDRSQMPVEVPPGLAGKPLNFERMNYPAPTTGLSGGVNSWTEKSTT